MASVIILYQLAYEIMQGLIFAIYIVTASIVSLTSHWKQE